ncbi:MAG: rhomboid family intramembrane serine protease [Rhodobacteraceae bacterium]|nr:rhomboid family intramembrane serine protease [Paracoccaceae bacterium]
MQTDHNAPPLNPLPVVVWLLLLPMLAAEVVFQLGAHGLAGGPAAVGWRLEAVRRFGFFAQVLDLVVGPAGPAPDLMVRFVAYPLVHGSFSHFLFVAVFLLALGKMVGEVFAGWAVAAVFFGATLAGALVYGLVLADPPPLIGGFPGVYGLIGAFTYLLWMRLAGAGPERYRAFQLIGFLLGIQLLFGALFGTGPDWIADLAGFCAGFALSFVVGPGGWARLLARLRAR